MSALADGQWLLETGQAKAVKVLKFAGDQCEWLRVVKGSWVQAVELYGEEVRRESGVAIGAIMVGVMPEVISGQSDKKVELKPALITVVTGVGLCEGRRFDISHRFDSDSGEMVFYGPVSVDGYGTRESTGWNKECGMEGVLVGPWPKRLTRMSSSSSGGEGLTK